MTPSKDTEELIVTGLVIGSLTIINKIFNLFVKRKMKGSSNAFSAGIQVYDIINDIMNKTPINRVIIYKAVNGGNKIKLGSHLTINSVQGSARPPLDPEEWKKYKGVVIDEENNRMLLEVSTKKVKKIPVDYTITNDPNPTLMNIYKANHILYSEVHHLVDNKKEYYFMTLSTTNVSEIDSNLAWRSDIDLNVSKISKIYSKNLN